LSKLLRVFIVMIASISLGASFKDVPKSHWAKESISQVNSQNILTGYQDNTFRGNNYINRYEMSGIISRMLDFIEKNGRYPTKKEMQELSNEEELIVGHKDGIFMIESKDSKIKYWMDGRIVFDYGHVLGSKNGIHSGVEARKIRFAIKTILYDAWSGEFDLSFTPNNDTEGDHDIKTQDLWMAYNVTNNLKIKLGNHKPACSIEEMTSSRWTMFMERSLPVGVFTLDRRLGFSVADYGEMDSIGWYYMTGVYGDELGLGSEEGLRESVLYAGRGAVKFDINDITLLTGFSSYFSDIPASDLGIVKLSTRGETHHHNIKLLDTGDILTNVNSRLIGSYELSLQKGPFLAQTEIFNANYFRKTGNQDAFFTGYYFWASYFLTGETRPYVADQAEFGGVVPINQDIGAWEVGVRFSYVNLNDSIASIYGGAANSLTFGLNWYVNPSIKIVANYIFLDVDSNANGDGTPLYTGDDDHQTFAMRFQYLF